MGCKAAGCKAASCEAAGCRLQGRTQQAVRLQAARMQATGCALQSCKPQGCRAKVRYCCVLTCKKRYTSRAPALATSKNYDAFNSRTPKSSPSALNRTRIACRRGGSGPGRGGGGGGCSPGPPQPQLTAEALRRLGFPHTPRVGGFCNAQCNPMPPIPLTKRWHRPLLVTATVHRNADCGSETGRAWSRPKNFKLSSGIPTATVCRLFHGD